MKLIKFIIYSILVIFGITLISGCTKKSKEPVKAEKGVILLTDINFNEVNLTLDGKWEFYWSKFLPPQSKHDSLVGFSGYIDVPTYWNGFKLKNGEAIKGKGFATYRLKIISDKSYSNLIIDCGKTMSAYKLWLNGKLIAQEGKISKSKEGSEPRNFFNTNSIVITKGENELLLQVSNFSHRNGGTFDSFVIGSATKMTQRKRKSTAIDLFLFGSIFIMALYHFGLYYLRRKDKSTLMFGFFALSIAIRTIITSDDTILIFYPDISWLLKMKLEYFTFFLGPPLMGKFIAELFHREFNKLAINISFYIGLTLCVATMFLDSYIFSFFVTPFQIILLVLIIYALVGLILATIRKREGALIVLLGLLALFSATINDILHVQNIIHTFELVPLGLFVLIFSQTYIIASRFSKAFTKNAELTETLNYQNKHLEEIVDERTVEIKQQNEEILSQKEELEAINDELEFKNTQLEKLSIIARETDNAVVIMDKNGKFEWINEGFTRLFGYNFNEYTSNIGTTIYEISTNQNVDNAFKKCVETKKSVDYESFAVTKSGETIWLQTTLTPIISEGKIHKVIAIDSNISELKEFEKNIVEKNTQIEKQNENIKSSIRYAKTIQEAILPRITSLNNLYNAFLVFKPKDIVSGDFYWFSQNKTKNAENIFTAVVDCTGHGVPGAFMSMISSRLLSEIVNERRIFSPAKILTELDTSLRKALKQDFTDNKDGLDICLCHIEKNNDNLSKITYAGAKRPLFHSKTGEKNITIVPATRKSIGGYKTRNKINFDETKIIGQKGDIIYLTTDGYSDQNNKNRKRIGTKNFVKKLHSIRTEPMAFQKKILEQDLEQYMKGTIQRDDITVLGIKL